MATYFIQKEVVNPITNEAYQISEIVAVNIMMIISIMQVLSLVPNFTAVSYSGTVGRIIFEVIERNPKIRNGSSNPG